VSDHFDGRRFYNPGHPFDPTPWQLIRWLTGGGWTPWPRHVPNRDYSPPPNRVGPDEAAVTFLGHATFLIRTAEGVVLTDPVFSGWAGPIPGTGPQRVRPPGLRLEQLPPLDAVLLSHNHYDHLDISALRRLRTRQDPLIVSPLKLGEYLRARGMRRVAELDWWESLPVGRLTVTLTPAQHYSARGPFDRNRTLWGGYAIGSAGRRVYFVGDTAAPGPFRAVRERLGPPDLALIPIGAYEPRWFMRDAHLDPDEAVRGHVELGSRQSVAMHFGTFRLTNEGIDEPPRRLREALRREGIDEGRFVVPDVGETRVFDLRRA
jgi:L-ascorbate metabolism protein UlaG (beta-lactamase superfamily)